MLFEKRVFSLLNHVAVIEEHVTSGGVKGGVMICGGVVVKEMIVIGEGEGMMLRIKRRCAVDDDAVAYLPVGGGAVAVVAVL